MFKFATRQRKYFSTIFLLFTHTTLTHLHSSLKIWKSLPLSNLVIEERCWPGCWHYKAHSYRFSRSPTLLWNNSVEIKLNWNVSHTTKMTLMDFQLTFLFPLLLFWLFCLYDGNIRMFGGNTCQNSTLYPKKRGCLFSEGEACVCM